mmetsp:Transcript_29127/g.88113  ORF Transcript_29127/g.88113 Transcript_29127/m.88113 type:complete len:87 (+) Transcript_29127:91-351(+)
MWRAADTLYKPILPLRQCRRNLLYLIFVPVFIRNHCGNGRFMFNCLAKCFFNLNVFTEPIVLRRTEADKGKASTGGARVPPHVGPQ